MFDDELGAPEKEALCAISVHGELAGPHEMCLCQYAFVMVRRVLKDMLVGR